MHRIGMPVNGYLNFFYEVKSLDQTVLNRLIKGFGANIYGQAVTILIQLVGVPVFLHAWGAQLYGEWLILFAIPAYLSMTDLGFSQSAANDMTNLVARGEREKSLQVFQSLIVLVLIASACMAVIVSLFIFLLPLDNWLHPVKMTSVQLRWTLWLLAITVLVQLPDGIAHAGFRANGEYALHFSLYSSTRLMQFASLCLTALAGGGPVQAAAAFCGIRALATFLFTFLLLRRHPWLDYGIRQASFAEFRRLFRPAMANLAIPLSFGLNIQGMVIAVGAVLGPLAVVNFSTLRTLTRFPLQLAFSVSNAAEPELAAAFGQGEKKLSASLFVNTLSTGLWLSLLSGGFLALFGDSILAVWTQGKVPMHTVLFYFLIASSIASVLWYAGLICLKAANLHARAALIFAISSAASVAIAVAFMSWTGRLGGAGVALLVTDSLISVYILCAACRLIGTRLTRTLLNMLRPPTFVRSYLAILLGKPTSALHRTHKCKVGEK